MIEPLFDHLLVPTDGSDDSIKAGRMAFRTAKAHAARVTLLHVIDDSKIAEIARVEDEPKARVREKLEVAGRGYLHHLEDIATQFNVDVETMTRDGEPHKVIVTVANTLGVDLIVMGHAGQRGPRRVPVGSVTERVLRFATCPVLVT